MSRLDSPATPGADQHARLLRAQDCTNMRLRRATRSLSAFYDVVMESSGLHGNQFMLLIPPYLNPGLTMNQLAQLTGLDRTTLARNVKLLQERRFVTVRPGADQRTRVIHTTRLGKQALEQALPLWEEAQRQVTETLGAQRLPQLYRSLDRLEDAFKPAPYD